jgi:hypothetical protein
LEPDSPGATTHRRFLFKTLKEAAMKQYNMKPFDLSAMLDIQRKNMEANWLLRAVRL